MIRHYLFNPLFRRAMESGSEGEYAYHNHHRSRHSRKSAESLPHLEQQWKDIQHRNRDRGNRAETRSNPGDDRERNG